jgi:hypothetical protein
MSSHSSSSGMDSPIGGGGSSTSIDSSGNSNAASPIPEWKPQSYMQQQQQQPLTPSHSTSPPTPSFHASPAAPPPGMTHIQQQSPQHQIQQSHLNYSISSSPPAPQSSNSSNRASLMVQAQDLLQHIQSSSPSSPTANNASAQQFPSNAYNQTQGGHTSLQSHQQMMLNLSSLLPHQVNTLMQQFQQQQGTTQQQPQLHPGQMQQQPPQSIPSSQSPSHYQPLSNKSFLQQTPLQQPASSFIPRFNRDEIPHKVTSPPLPSNQNNSPTPINYSRPGSQHLLSPQPQQIMPQQIGMQQQQQFQQMPPSPQHMQQQQQPSLSAFPGQSTLSDSQSVAQVQQWQQHLLSVMQKKGGSGEDLRGPPLSRPSSIDERSSSSTAGSSPYLSPLSASHGLIPSPSITGNTTGRSLPRSATGALNPTGFQQSTFNSARSQSRTISGGIGSLNPAAAVFDPTFSSISNPASPAHAAQSPSNRFAQQRTGSNSPLNASSPSPMSAISNLSVSRSMDGTLLPLSAMAYTASAQLAQQQQFDDQLRVLGLPSLPFDKREIDAQVAREREDHAAYIYEFRTRVCEAYLNGNCPSDAYTCFQTHARLPRRR